MPEGRGDYGAYDKGAALIAAERKKTETAEKQKKFQEDLAAYQEKQRLGTPVEQLFLSSIRQYARLMGPGSQWSEAVDILQHLDILSGK